MRNFILGLVVGAAATYVVSKLTDDKTREELFEDVDKVTDAAKGKLKYGRGQAMRVGVRARQEIRKGKKKLSQVAGDYAGKLSDELSELEEKAKSKA